MKTLGRDWGTQWQGVEQHGADLVGALAESLVEEEEIRATIGGK
ncbi:MAG: hypothetical protein Q8Q59_09815 [Luteolibacter sp.]|jgi:hypothetical protein|nr:hypothetical protein [Luteolibacter sp.]